MSKVARVSPMKLAGREGVLVQTPFDEVLVESLKVHLPRGDRWWNKHRKGWWIADESKELALHLVRECYPTIVLVDESGDEIIHTADGGRLRQERLI